MKTLYSFTLPINNKEITFNIKKSPTTKKINLKPCFKTFGGILIIPYYFSYEQAKNFAIKHIEWLYNILNQSSPQSFSTLNNITLLGKIISIHVEKNIKNSITLTDNTLKITTSTIITHMLPQIKKYLHHIIKDYITNAVENYTKSLKVTYNKIFIRESRTRWGSCSTKKNISINWRLIFAPKEVLDYVIFHEVAHLVHFNHSKNFWQLVEKYHPNYKILKTWLKQYGNTLYCIIF